MPAPDLSAIVLGYRAGESLIRVIEPLAHLLEQSGLPHELIIVANESPGDATPEVAQRFASGRPEVHVVSVTKRGGMGWDMRTGLEAARGEVMVVIDGDGQNPVDDVLKLYELMRASGADVGKAWRVSRQDGTYRRLLSFVYNAGFQLLFPMRGLHDVNGKPKALTRKAYTQLDLRSDDWFIDAEIVLGARERGLAVVELPVTFLRNDERPSFVNAAAIGEFAWHLLRRRFKR